MDRTLRNITGKSKDGGEMDVYGNREGGIRMIRGKPVKSSAGNAKPIGVWNGQWYQKEQSHLEERDRKLADARWHWIGEHREKEVQYQWSNVWSKPIKTEKRAGCQIFEETCFYCSLC